MDWVTLVLAAATVALAYFTWKMAEGVKTQSKLLHTQMGSDVHFENVRPLPDNTMELRLYNYGQGWVTDVALQSVEVTRGSNPIKYALTRATETNRIGPKSDTNTARWAILIKLEGGTQLSTLDVFRDLGIKITVDYKDKYVKAVQRYELKLVFSLNESPVLVQESTRSLTE